MILKRVRLGIVALAVLALPLPHAMAGDGGFIRVDMEQDEAREAVQRGLIRPLEEVLSVVRGLIKGDIVEIELDEDDGRYVYEIEYVASDGHLMEIEIDAKTLAVVSHGPDDED